ncbi:prolyl oligopeptidase family serine peptidase [Flavobacterium sediminilitoris]|uniref:Prolyl oligopeptidase family serine peptidase n=1 Tax=Flavobacterium sediminilitoris TaxID=2024526 RepID=A0ABY4HQZ0_9FLAO|nr:MULTISPECIES: prolyl oligopeptidase family serine peptidase [Flavobacterium]UOX35030.1 prolyl oligopeptidase family serine peptidase [Flavobacterium sediminilitoris]
MKKTVPFLFIILTSLLNAQSLQLENIMKGDEFIGNQPDNHRWSIDGNSIYFDWNPNNEVGNSTYYWNQNMDQPQLLPENEFDKSEVNASLQSDYDVIYYAKRGNLYSYNKKSKKIKKLYVSTDKIYAVERSSNPDVIFYQQNRNVYQLNVKEFSITQLTNFKTGNESVKSDKTENYLEKQQVELFQFVRDNKVKDDWYEKKYNNTKNDFPQVIFYGSESLEQLKPSPNGKFVTFRLSNYSSQKQTKIEHFITADGYTKNESARSKVSIDNLSKHKMGVYNIEKDSVYYVSFSNLSGIKEFPAYYQEYDNLKEKEKEEKPIVMINPIHNKNGDKTVFELRSLDNKDRWIVSLDLETGILTELDHQHDEAWIGGPGIPNYSFGGGTLGFLKDNETIYFQSETTGYSHLYTLNLNTKKKTQLTSGNWEVRDVSLSLDGKSFYLSTNTNHPGNREYHKLDITSKKMTAILNADGAHEVVLSPDEKKIAVRYSYKNKPWELYVADNKPNATLKQITFSTTPEFKAYNWKNPEVVTFKAEDGTNVYARLYQPKVEKKNKAAIIFVHGAGYLQNAHNYWSSYHREFMFHNLLSDLGYTILDIDYRGSDGYGRDVRTGIYRHMGGLDLLDQLDGKKYLVDNLGIEADRVGIYGGSYGGFITLMALLTKPNEFKAGAALRSVTDWAHYNHGYTSNILNFPETDSIAYRRSSPIYFAENLNDRLIMLHGMVDDNVQFQDVVRLSQRFIELGKKDWDLAVFPVEEHGFKETYSWIDEYRRILELFNKNLLDKR